MQAKIKTSKSKAGFLGKTTESDLCHAIEELHKQVIQKYRDKLQEILSKNKELSDELEAAQKTIEE